MTIGTPANQIVWDSEIDHRVRHAPKATSSTHRPWQSANEAVHLNDGIQYILHFHNDVTTERLGLALAAAFRPAIVRDVNTQIFRDFENRLARGDLVPAVRVFSDHPPATRRFRH